MADVNVRVASVVPELAAVAVKVVVPHPLDVVGDDSDAMLNVGNTNSILSAVPVCIIGAFSSNVYAIADGDHVPGSAIASVLTVSACATTARGSRAAAQVVISMKEASLVGAYASICECYERLGSVAKMPAKVCLLAASVFRTLAARGFRAGVV